MTTIATKTKAPVTTGSMNYDVLFSCLAGLNRYHAEGHRFYTMHRGSKDWKTQGNIWRYAEKNGLVEIPRNVLAGTLVSGSCSLVKIRITDKGREWLREQRAEGGAG